MTRSLFSSWSQLRQLSSAVIFVDIGRAFYSVLVEEVVGLVMERSDGAPRVESKKQFSEAVLEGRQHETALVRMAPTLR